MDPADSTVLCRARDVLQQLMFPSNSMGVVTGIDVMAAAGVAFTFVSKGGVGLSVMAGHGFVIRKVIISCCGLQHIDAASDHPLKRGWLHGPLMCSGSRKQS